MTNPSFRTTYKDRFAVSIAALVGNIPPADLVDEWVNNVEVDGAHRLQHWVGENLPSHLSWAQCIVLLDAAHVLAASPEEGEDHEPWLTHGDAKDAEDDEPLVVAAVGAGIYAPMPKLGVLARSKSGAVARILTVAHMDGPEIDIYGHESLHAFADETHAMRQAAETAAPALTVTAQAVAAALASTPASNKLAGLTLGELLQDALGVGADEAEDYVKAAIAASYATLTPSDVRTIA